MDSRAFFFSQFRVGIGHEEPADMVLLGLLQGFG